MNQPTIFVTLFGILLLNFGNVTAVASTRRQADEMQAKESM